MLHDVFAHQLPDRALKLAVLIALICATAAGSAGCSGVSCDQPHCQKDPVPTQQMIDTCNNAHSNKCSGPYNDYQSCINSKTVCDPGTQISDSVSHEAAVAACKPKYDVYYACVGTL